MLAAYCLHVRVVISVPARQFEIDDDLGDALIGKLPRRDRRHLACTLPHNREELLVFARERHQPWPGVASSLGTMWR
jgi:hypothetical protein